MWFTDEKPKTDFPFTENFPSIFIVVELDLVSIMGRGKL